MATIGKVDVMNHRPKSIERILAIRLLARLGGSAGRRGIPAGRRWTDAERYFHEQHRPDAAIEQESLPP